MRKLIGLLSALVLAVLLCASPSVSAVVPDIKATPNSTSGASLILGQNHNYSVHYRSNGEAIITARVVFHNRDSEDLKSLTLEIPGNVYEVYSLQQILPQTCKRYATDRYQYNSTTCAEYQDPDYTQTYYDYSYSSTDRGVEYKKLKPEQNNSKFTFTLPSAIPEDKSGALIIAYATKSYAKTTWGNTSFDFSSFKASERIQKLKVAVTFDDDIYYEGKQSKTQYAPELSSGINSLADGASANNTSLKNYIGSIGTQGVLTKEASNLAPGDSFHVRGSYATNWWALHRNQLIWTVVGLMALVVGFFLFTRWRARRPKTPHKPDVSAENSPQTNNDETTTSTPVAKATRVATGNMRILKLNVTPMFGSFLYALFSVLLAAGAALLISLAAAAALHDTESYNLSGAQSAAYILGIAAVVLAILLGLFTLPVLIARRRGLRYLFTTLLFEVVWILIAVFIIAQFTNGDTAGSNNRYYQYDDRSIAQ